MCMLVGTRRAARSLLTAYFCGWHLQSVRPMSRGLQSQWVSDAEWQPWSAVSGALSPLSL